MSLSHAPSNYERSPQMGTSLDDLDADALDAYIRERIGSRFPDDTLEQRAARLGLMARSGSLFTPTVAGLLAFGHAPQLLNPNWGVSAVHIDGTQISEPILQRSDFEGSLRALLDACTAFVRDHSRSVTSDSVDPASRLVEFPEDAVREALVNALLHRDLRMPGRVSIRLFHDRLEIWNPGASLTLESPLDETSRDGGVSMPRNMILASTLRILGVGEQIGRGLALIRRSVARITHRPVEWITNKTDTLLILPSALYVPGNGASLGH